MSDAEALQEFLNKWRGHWPEWAVAEVFLPAAQRAQARAWLALRSELLEAAWGGEDPTPGAAKLGWWEEELAGWARGARRHPLGLALQKCPVDWRALVEAIPALRASRVPDVDCASALAVLMPFAQAQTAIAAGLCAAPSATSAQASAEALLQEWVLHLPERGVVATGTDVPSLLALAPMQGGARVERIHAALVRERLRRASRGQAGALPPLAVVWASWQAARRS